MIFGRVGDLNFKITQIITLVSSDLISDADISAKFTDYFSGLSCSDNTTRCNELNEQYLNKHSTYLGYPLFDSHRFDIETVDNVMSELNRGKAAGLDEITLEQLFLFSHPALTLVLTRLFNIMLVICVLSENFYESYYNSYS